MNDHTVDFAVLVMRLTLGPMLLAHGYNKVFGGGKLAGTERWFASLGLRPAWLHARLAAGNEWVVAFLITLGLLTPLACTGYIGLMTVAAFTDHKGKGFFIFKGGWEYVAVVGMMCVALATIGPGEWSLDHALDIDRYGIGYGIAAGLVGFAVGVGLLAVSYRPEPAKEAKPTT